MNTIIYGYCSKGMLFLYSLTKSKGMQYPGFSYTVIYRYWIVLKTRAPTKSNKIQRYAVFCYTWILCCFNKKIKFLNRAVIGNIFAVIWFYIPCISSLLTTAVDRHLSIIKLYKLALYRFTLVYKLIFVTLIGKVGMMEKSNVIHPLII